MSVQFQSSVDIIFSLFDIRSRISGLGRSPHCRFIPFGIVLHSQTLFSGSSDLPLTSLGRY